MRKLQTIAIVIFSTIIFSSCVVSTHETQVSVMNQETEMNYFDKVDVAGSMNVVLEQGDKCSVTVKGENEEAFRNLVVYVNKRGTLCIETQKALMRVMFSNGMEGITVYVTTPTIKKISMAGSGELTTGSPIRSENLKVSLAGSGDVVFKKLLTCDKLHVDLAGSGNVTVKQLKADKLHTNLAGSGNAEYYNLDVAYAKSNIAGSGNVILQGKVGSHKEGIAGSGSVDLSGLITR